MSLPGEFEGAWPAYDTQAFIAGAGAFRVFELSLDVVAVFLAFAGEGAAGVLSGGYDAVGGEFGGAAAGDLAFDDQIAGFAGCAVFSSEVAGSNGAGKLPG